MKMKKYKVSTRDFVYDSLRESIMQLELPPGSAISEKEISEELEVSRTPVREAFLRLTEDELLTVLPQRGSFVALIDLDHVEEARFLREQAELGIFKLACQSEIDGIYIKNLEKNLNDQRWARDNNDEETLFMLDKQFHELVAQSVDKSRVWKMIQKMDVHSSRLRKLSLTMKLNWRILVEQHEDLLEAVKNKDAESSDSLVRKHLSLLKYDQKQLKKEYPEYFI
ncbi:GntR family transcriptional regulator [Corticicoccus populi]|uniref:GntR family transcriptional regulator n=1 Tax=Corticicoccus populi TaxID=1812821 RepID=A0ABW5WWQ7_9STAP